MVTLIECMSRSLWYKVNRWDEYGNGLSSRHYGAAGIILCMRPEIERRRCNETSCIIDWAHPKKAANCIHNIVFLLFFSTQLYFTIFTFFVTTRQSSTYKQSTTDSEVCKLDCIRTFVSSYDNVTHNNAPRATGNGLEQCGTAITRSIFFKFSHQTTHISPVRTRNGCLLCFSSLNCVLLLSVQCCV